jgi:hypothetical protein
MDGKQLEVDCPSCNCRLAVDVRTARVLRWSTPKETDPLGRPKVTEQDWDSAIGRVRRRGERLRDGFASALAQEQAKEEELDRRFDSVARRLREREPEQAAVRMDAAPGLAGSKPWPRGLAWARRLAALGSPARGAAVPWIVSRADALGLDPAAHAAVRTLPDGGSEAAAVELQRQGFQVRGALGIWVQETADSGEGAAAPTAPALVIEPEEPDLALLEPAADGPLEPEVLVSALAAARAAGRSWLALRLTSFDPREALVEAAGFRLSHLELCWSRGPR